MRRLSKEEMMFGLIEGDFYEVKTRQKVYKRGVFYKYELNGNDIRVFIGGGQWTLYNVHIGEFDYLFSGQKPLAIEAVE
jgi:hypothetical protein